MQPQDSLLIASFKAPPWRTWIKIVIGSIVMAWIVLGIFWMQPHGEGITLAGSEIPELCPSQILLHQDCWGCGMGRASVAFVQGNWRTAWDFHPGVFFLIALFLWRGYVVRRRRSAKA